MLAKLVTATFSRSADRKGPPRLPTRLNGMIVVALTVFFFGLVIWRVPVEGYVVTAIVEFDQRDVPDTALARDVDVTQDFIDRNVVATAMRFANHTTSAGEGSAGDSLSKRQIDRVLGELEVRRIESDSGSAQFQLSYRGSDPAWSSALVDQLVRSTLLRCDADKQMLETFDRKVRVARWQVDETRHYEKKIRVEMDGLMEVGLQRAADGDWPEPDAAARDLAVIQPNQRNPDWTRLQAELVRLTSARQVLLKDFTPRHPRVEELAMRIQETQGELDNTPELIESADAGAVLSKPDVGRPDVASTTEFAPPSGGGEVGADSERFADIFARLKSRHATAAVRRERAEATLAELLLQRDAARESMEDLASRVTVPASIIRQVGGRPSTGRVATLGILALACGVSMAWSIGTLGGLRHVNSIDELDQLLAIPIVGQVSIDPVKPTVGRLAKRGKIIGWTTSACETALGLLIVVFVIGAVGSSSALPEFGDNPFGAIGHTVAQVWERWN